MKDVRVTDIKEPTRVVNFATIAPLVTSRTGAIHLVRDSRRTTPVHLQVAKRAAGSSARLAQLKTKQFSMPRASGVISRVYGTGELTTIGVAELDLAPGMPRFVNAATLKRMVKADAHDLLLKRSGDRWEICDDSLRIDLFDGSIEFRLGAIQIWS